MRRRYYATQVRSRACRPLLQTLSSRVDIALLLSTCQSRVQGKCRVSYRRGLAGQSLGVSRSNEVLDNPVPHWPDGSSQVSFPSRGAIGIMRPFRMAYSTEPQRTRFDAKLASQPTK